MAFGNQHSHQFKLAVTDRANHVNDFYDFNYNGVRYCIMSACGFTWEAYVVWPATHPDCNKSFEKLNRIYPNVHNRITRNNGLSVGFTTETECDYNLLREFAYGKAEGYKAYRSFDFVKQEICKLAMRIKKRMDDYQAEMQRQRVLNYNNYIHHY